MISGVDTVLFSISGLRIWYQKDIDIIKNGKFSLNSNQVTGLLGINGSGKTTLINVLSSVHKKYSLDTFCFDGKEVKLTDTFYKMQRYVVFTEEQAFMYWTFNHYFKFIHNLYDKSVDTKYLEYLIVGFGFEKYLGYMLKDLSSGNKKKAFLITGFSLGLPLLIMDEPLDGLDFTSSEFLYEAINGYKCKGSILMSSHIAESFEKTCDNLMLLDDGLINSKTFENGMDIREALEVWRREH